MIVTLTTDWHRSDYYTGSLKGGLLSVCPDVQIIDISHNIQPFNTTEAAMILRLAYPHFPQGSLHLIGVNSEPSPEQELVLVKFAGHFFAGPNDGMFNLLLENAIPELCVALPLDLSPAAFRALPAFTRALKAVSDKRTGVAGTPCSLKKAFGGLPTYDNNGINGQVVYFDSYGNAHSNISKELFDRVCRGRQFEIILYLPFLKIQRIASYYSDAATGELLGLFNSAGFLEFARCRSDLEQLEGLVTGASVRVKFS